MAGEITQSLDHDTLIRIEAKMEGVMLSIAELKSSNDLRIRPLESDVADLKKLRDSLDIPALLKEHHDNTRWISDFKLTWKIVLGAVLVMSGIVGYLLSQAANYVKVFSK